MRRIDFPSGSWPVRELTAGSVFSDISSLFSFSFSLFLFALRRAVARPDKVDCFRLHYGNFQKSFRYVSIFLAEEKGGGWKENGRERWYADATYPRVRALWPRSGMKSSI